MRSAIPTSAGNVAEQIRGSATATNTFPVGWKFAVTGASPAGDVATAVAGSPSRRARPYSPSVPGEGQP